MKIYGIDAIGFDHDLIGILTSLSCFDKSTLIIFNRCLTRLIALMTMM